MKKFALSVLATQNGTFSTNVANVLHVVDAVSSEEAVGKIYNLSIKEFPFEEMWKLQITPLEIPENETESKL